MQRHKSCRTSLCACVLLLPWGSPIRQDWAGAAQPLLKAERTSLQKAQLWCLSRPECPYPWLQLPNYQELPSCLDNPVFTSSLRGGGDTTKQQQQQPNDQPWPLGFLVSTEVISYDLSLGGAALSACPMVFKRKWYEEQRWPEVSITTGTWPTAFENSSQIHY